MFPRAGRLTYAGDVIEAAGGLVWRVSGKGLLKVLVVHRPRYDDWSFPKGKLERGETHLQAARREVAEETGLRCTTTCELRETRYRDRKGRPKRVRYWAMVAVSGSFVCNDEVDDVEWLTIDAARARLSYRHDVRVLEGLARAVRHERVLARHHRVDAKR